MKDCIPKDSINHSGIIHIEKMASLGNLTSEVAHEINTPISAIKSNSDLFIRCQKKIKKILFDPSTPREILNNKELVSIFNEIDSLNEVNKTAIDRITSIVDSLRNFSRIDKDEMENCDLVAGLESTLTLVRHKLKGKIKIRKNYEAVPVIQAFPNLINQVFLNIIMNAIHAIEDNGEIFIHLFMQDNFVVIEIRDTGQGIPDENLNKIFDSGFTTKKPCMGTGLGLPIVHKILAKHNGKINVESEVGKGSTFSIYLPIQ